MDDLSPELVLVDPQLAVEARRLHPDPTDCCVPRDRDARLSERPLRSLAQRPELRPARSVTAPGVAWGKANKFALHRTCGVPIDPLTTTFYRVGIHAEGAAPTAVPVSESANQEPARDGRPSFLGVVGGLIAALLIGSPAVDLFAGGPAGPFLLPKEATTHLPDSREARRERSDKESTTKASFLQWPSVEGADMYDVVLWRNGRRVADLWPRMNRVELHAASSTRDRTIAPGRYEWFVFPVFRNGGSSRAGRLVANGAVQIKAAS